MANPDPFLDIIADGRVRVRPIQHYGLPHVLTVDLDFIADNMTRNAVAVYTNCINVRKRYTGSHNNVTTAITGDVTMMINFAIAQTYNRLRSILERKAPEVRATRMNHRAPVPTSQEFPQWISSTLGSIGHIRVVDGPQDYSVVYATTAATQNHYGRAEAIVLNEGHYCRFIEVAKECNFTLSALPPIANDGSYFPTCQVISEGDIFRVYGALHYSHYENEDVLRTAFCCSLVGNTGFENVGITLGYVDNEATLTALAAVAAPAGIPAGQTAASPGRPVGINYRVNYYGIQPAVAAQGATPAQASGCYILGRGVGRIFHCSLADQLSPNEMFECFRHRLLR